jgi:hypothetical protein
MTVADNTSRDQYTATSGQTVFPYTFEIFNKDDVVVIKNTTTLIEGTNYTVTGVGNENGGSIVLTAGATTGDIITVYRDMPLERNSDYQTSGDFLASEVNNDFDRLWLAAQQINELSARSIKKPDSDSASINMVLPVALNRADKMLAFDGTGAVVVPNIPYSTLENFLQQASLLNLPTDLGLISDPVIVYTYDLGAL